jgi:hypothetical protein
MSLSSSAKARIGAADFPDSLDCQLLGLSQAKSRGSGLCQCALGGRTLEFGASCSSHQIIAIWDGCPYRKSNQDVLMAQTLTVPPHATKMYRVKEFDASPNNIQFRVRLV